MESRLRRLLREKAGELGCKILALETTPDHVHVYIRAPPVVAPNAIIAKLKGHTSGILRQEFPELRSRLPTLWSRSYFASTQGNVSSEMIRRYVEGQEGV